ncbi:MAG: hypothetical protein K2H81_05905 [Alistipes sp.]|nr:hypothetical protein [Alistipes sp.]
MEEGTTQLLTWALPSGFLSSLITWIVSRRRRNNDFLAALQRSIDLLSEKYTGTLNENIRLQADNARLLANQKIMEEKIDSLNSKIDRLTRRLNRLQHEKPNRGTPPGAAPHRDDDGLHDDAKRHDRGNTTRRPTPHHAAGRGTRERLAPYGRPSAAGGADGYDDDPAVPLGAGRSGAERDDDSDPQPP